MLDALLGAVHQTVSSPWLYAVVAGLTVLGMVVPVVPGETAVVTAGVAATTGQPNLMLIIAAAVGAFVGDHIAYTLGRSAGGPLARRLQARPATKRACAFTGHELSWTVAADACSSPPTACPGCVPSSPSPWAWSAVRHQALGRVIDHDDACLRRRCRALRCGSGGYLGRYRTS